MNCFSLCAVSGETEDRIQGFFTRFQFFFNFVPEKYLVIRDWRLGLILRLLQLGVLIYTIVSIVSKASYLKQEVPKGVITPWTSVNGKQRDEMFNVQKKRYRNDSLPYCENSTRYEYEWNDVTYKDFKCVVLDSLTIPVPGESKFFFTTYLRLDKLFFVSKNEKGKCPPAQTIDLPKGTKKLEDYFGTCLYTQVEHRIPIVPEIVPLVLMHSYYTSTVGKSGANPETIISTPGYSKGGKLKFNKDVPPSFTLQELLNVAGIDLDKPLDQQSYKKNINPAAKSNKAIYADQYPMARISGVNIIMHFKYYLRSLAPGSHQKSSGSGSNDVICLIELEPQLIWSMEGLDVQQRIQDAYDPFLINPKAKNDGDKNSTLKGMQVDYQRNGVRLTFQVSGTIGVFDFFYLMNAFVSAAVLLGVAQTIVTFIALYCLGITSQLYMEFMREPVNWRKEYARFAAQSLVAGTIFKQYDTNHSKELDRTEIYALLCETIPEETLTREKIALMADFIMRQGEQTTEVSKGRLDTAKDIKLSTINITEWIDIFTEEKVKMTALNRLIDQEYKDKKITEMLVRLATGRHVRGLEHANTGDIIGSQYIVTETSMDMGPSGKLDSDQPLLGK